MFLGIMKALQYEVALFVFFLLIRFSVLPHRKAEAVRTVRRR